MCSDLCSANEIILSNFLIKISLMIHNHTFAKRDHIIKEECSCFATKNSIFVWFVGTRKLILHPW